PGNASTSSGVNVALNSRNRPTTTPTITNHVGRIPDCRPMLDVVNTNIAAVRIAKNSTMELPKIGNSRAATGSIRPPAYSTLVATTANEAAATNISTTNTMPLMSWRFDCRKPWVRPEAAAHIRSATLNHRNAMPENGRTYSPAAVAMVGDPVPHV